MALESAAPLPAVDQEGRSLDRRSLSLRHQYPARQAGTVRAVRGRRQQGRGQPSLAQGEGGPGRPGPPAQIEKKRKAFPRKWRLKCRAVADSLEEAGERLFAFTRLDPSQWKSARTTNAIERLNGEFRRRIKTQTVLPCAGTVPMRLWALPASGQIQMRKVAGWETLSRPLEPMPLDLAA